MIYVNGTTGDDAWDGLCETWDGGTCGPKETIQAGIDAAAHQDHAVLDRPTAEAVDECAPDQGSGPVVAVRRQAQPLEQAGQGRAA